MEELRCLGRFGREGEVGRMRDGRLGWVLDIGGLSGLVWD